MRLHVPSLFSFVKTDAAGAVAQSELPLMPLSCHYGRVGDRCLGNFDLLVRV